MEKLAKAVLNLRWFIIAVVFILTVFLGFQISNMEINSDVVSALPDDDPDVALFKKVGQDFGGNKIGMIILEADDIFHNDVIYDVKKLTDSIGLMEGIASVTSITNIIDIRSDQFGFEIGKLIDEYNLPYSDEDLLRLKNRVFSKEMFRGVVVSEDATATLIMFTLTDGADIQTVGRAVIDKAESLQLDERLYYAGMPMMVTAISELISRDLIRLLPIAFLVIAIVLFFSFRSVRGVLLPLLTAAIAIIWTLGIMVLAGYKMTMVTNNIPILLLAIGSAYTIHVINKINQVKEKDFKKAILSALSYIFIPVTLASLTTIVGFISFIFEAYLTMIKDFGIFTAVGTFISAVLALFFAPAVIYAFSFKSKRNAIQENSNRKSLIATYLLLPLKNLLFRHPKYTLTIWSLLILLSSASIFLIQRNVDIKDYFKQDNPARLAEDIMIEKFGGSKPIFISFKGDVQSPELLNTMLRTEERLKESSYVFTTQSIADLIVEMNDALGEGRQIPDDRDKIEQMWFLLEGNSILKQFVSDNLDEGLIISKFASSDNAEKEEFAREMEQFINENTSDAFEINMTGMPFIDMKMNRSLLTSQIRSLLIAILALILIVGIILRSFPTGLYATAPIIAAIVVLFGVMGITGIPLNIVTVLVASIALGIGIDYSIHVISHFNHSYKNGKTLDEALEDTIMISGKSIFINVVSVSAGFMVLIFSEMVPLQYFGILMALSMIGSGLAALTLLPVILILAHRRRLS
ncbi:MAG: MMPL family transporter [Bacteroidetes bacterium]|nr:MMPL family transporter [Bacteroidota bacterium]